MGHRFVDMRIIQNRMNAKDARIDREMKARQMRRTGTHTHHCRNKSQGCTAAWECANRHLESNGDGQPICSLNPCDEFDCLDCDSSRCSDCGSVLNVHAHADDCAKATQV